MTRLIDTMTKSEIQVFLGCLSRCGLNARELECELETLFSKESDWSDSLDPQDDQTWVLCFVSDKSPEETRFTAWVDYKLNELYCVAESHREGGDCWLYATPIALDIRYKEEGE